MVQPGGGANGRTLAYLAHLYLGNGFGTAYDVSTIAILWFAGASAMAGLLNLVPRYLPRYGMTPAWALAARPLVLVFAAIAFLVTWVFDADVDSQAGAYATGVLVLITSAAFAVTLSAYRRRDRMAWAYALITLVFVVTTVANMVERPDGLKIAGCFIAAILIVSLVSRVIRAYELRATGITFDETAAGFLREAVPSGVINVIANEPNERDERDERDEQEYQAKWQEEREVNRIPVDEPTGIPRGVGGRRLRVRGRPGNPGRGAVRLPGTDREQRRRAEQHRRDLPGHTGRVRAHPARLLRLDRGEPADPFPALHPVGLGRGRTGHP
jgi:hypothetical protein